MTVPYRVLLTGIHLMRTGRVEASLTTLNQDFRLPYIPDLIARKIGGAENSILDSAQVEFYSAEYQRLLVQLEQTAANSRLPNESTGRDELNDLLVRLRLRDSV